MHTDDLITLVSSYAEHVGRSEATVSNRIVGHARLFARLRSGRGTTIKTYHRVLQWFSDHWPADLPWPSGIPRPPRSQEAA